METWKRVSLFASIDCTNFWSIQQTSLPPIVDEMSFFVGASTWAPGQLENEMAHGFWIPCRGPAEIALAGTCEHEPSTSKFDPPPANDLWLSMMSACGQDEARLASIFHYQEWNENMLPCDAFDGEDIDPDIF